MEENEELKRYMVAQQTVHGIEHISKMTKNGLKLLKTSYVPGQYAKDVPDLIQWLKTLNEKVKAELPDAKKELADAEKAFEEAQAAEGSASDTAGSKVPNDEANQPG